MKKEEILNKIKNTRILAVIGIVATFLGIILPYVRYSFWGSTLSISLWRYWQGDIALILVIANAVFIFKDYIQKYIPKLLDIPAWRKISEMNNPKLALIPTIILAILVIWLTFVLDFRINVYSLGFYSLWLGVICLIAYAIMNKGNVTENAPINNNVNINGNEVQQNMNQNYNNMNNYNNGMQPNMNQNYNNMNNYNNGMQPNMNQNYNNMNNYNNGIQPNMNQNYNNMNNYNNEMQPNVNPNYNNQNNMNNNE